jgi:putative Ca2+/H+ antiporter (TMEM165/GDT1 family)
MLLADVPAVLCGHVFAHKINPRWVRYAAAAIFAVLGVTVLWQTSLFK